MGFFSNVFRFARRRSTAELQTVLRSRNGLYRRCRIEEMEDRRLMAADVQIGAVEFDPHNGEDKSPNVFTITWDGGAAGTDLTHLEINTDIQGTGTLQDGDPFFNTTPNPPGVYGYSPFQVVSADGIVVTSVSVVNGGMALDLSFTGFTAGKVLQFSIDMDHMNVGGADAVVDGFDFEGAKLTATLSNSHYYDFNSTANFYDEYNQNFAGSGLDLPPDDYEPPATTSQIVYTAGAIIAGSQKALPSSLSGVVYEDHNLDNIQEAGDPGIPNVSLTLYQWDGEEYVSTGLTTTTDANGAYKFNDLQPGQYQVRETQPNGYFSVGASAGTVAGVTDGVVTDPNTISSVTLQGGDNSIQNDFSESLPGKISGYVYYDPDNNGIKETGEPGIPGTTVNLYDSNLNLVGTTTTDANGFYQFNDLAYGNYTVVKIPPTGYLDGKDSVGSVGGTLVAPDTITNISITDNTNAQNYNFGELLPASISGIIYVDQNGDNKFESGEPLLAGVTVQLFNSNNQVVATTTTDQNGQYKFTGLAPFASYTVHEVQPTGYFETGDSVGSVGGTLEGVDTIASVNLGSGVNGTDYDFNVQAPASIDGMVLVDTTGNCTYEPGDPVLAGVTIQLLDSNNQVVATTTTDQNGQYQFTGLRPGTYSVHEVQPPGYIESGDSVGSAGGTLQGPDTINTIALGSGANGMCYDFFLEKPASVAGVVFVDQNGTSVYQAGDPLLAGVTVELLNAQNQVVATTTTNQNGQYLFSNLAPLATYTVHELQPNGYFESGDSVGSAGGTLQGLDTITSITLGFGQNATDYDFCVVAPASIDGMVFIGPNANCAYQSGDPPLAGVTIQLLNSQNQVVSTTVTNQNGEYEFTGLRPSTYTVHEVQPVGYFESGDSAGSAGGTLQGLDTITSVTLGSGVNGMCYDFSVLAPATINGMVFIGPNANCAYQSGDPVLAGVTIQLLNSQNQVVGTTVTNQNGEYEFTGLVPGAYTVHEVQPSGYYETGDSLGSAGGTLQGLDTITNIPLASGATGMCYDFSVLGPASIDGIVFVGPNANCTYQSGDTVLAGVTIQLLNSQNQVIASTVTDQHGMYDFTGLVPGTYTVHEVQPAHYTEIGATLGSAGGTVQGLDTMTNITLGPGVLGMCYDFELKSPVLGILPPSTFNIPSLQPMANPPTPVIIIPVIQAFPVTQQFSLYYGGGYAYGNTWHLSVIDAGEPRGTNATAPQISMISMKSDPFAMEGEDVQNAEWVLGNGESEEGVKHFVRFGMRNGIPVTGDFNGDGITDVGFFYAGQWFIDLDDNGQWDQGDLWAKLGHEGDLPVTGDWDGDGKTDIGIFGRAWPGDPSAIRHEPGLPAPENTKIGQAKNIPPRTDEAALGFRTLKHTSKGDYRADVIDHVFHYGTAGDIPVTGDWHGTGVHTIGLFYKGRWLLDSNGDGKWTETDHDFHYGAEGDRPIIGDFNGDGLDELGVYRDGTWYIDTNNDRVLDAKDKLFQLGGPGDVPVVGDWNGDGVDEPGVYHQSLGTAAAPAPADAPTVTE